MNYCHIFGFFQVKNLTQLFFIISACLLFTCLPFCHFLCCIYFQIGVYILLYHILALSAKSSPSKSDKFISRKNNGKEIREIEKRFYRYFCDLFLETFKTLTISKENMVKHCEFEPETQAIINQLAEENQSFMIVMGHFGNWEWGGNTFSICCKHQLYVIYHPLSNKYFNGLMYRMRTRFGTRLIPMKDTLREMLKNRDELTATAFIADQSPLPDRAYWMNFMNQDTPVFLGIEKIALKIRYPIVYITIRRVKRGYYKVFAERIELPSSFRKRDDY